MWRRWFGTEPPPEASNASLSKDETADCPLCQQFGSGPCGPSFWTWRNCTLGHPDDYLTACQKEFQAFHACLAEQDKES